MGNRVARIKTEVSEAQMAQAIIESWKDLFGGLPAKEQVAMLLAQNALETGHRKSMWNFNVGNVTTSGKGSIDYQDEVFTDEQIKPGVWEKRKLKFRAYPTLKDGVLDYIKLISSGGYSKAWQNVLHPDPTAFSKALKAQGYYTANEVPYTKALVGLFSQFSRSKGYDNARAGNVMPPAPLQVAKMQSIMPNEPVANFNNVLDRYMHMVAAAPKISLKRLYKTALQNHNIIITIKSSDKISEIEFSRILCSALDEDLLSTSYPHTDGNLVEIECSIAGPDRECFQAVQEMSKAIADSFKDATIKLGGLTVETKCFMNKKSSYLPISHKTAETNYRKFLLKFI